LLEQFDFTGGSAHDLDELRHVPYVKASHIVSSYNRFPGHLVIAQKQAAKIGHTLCASVFQKWGTEAFAAGAEAA